jgi:type III secretory pathway component EscR
VTTFIKAEEQNYSLYNYVNLLSSEIDNIEEHNNNIEVEIQRHEKLAEISANDKEAYRQTLKQEIEERSTQMAEKENQIKNIESQLATIKDNVQHMVEAFRLSHFFLSVAQNMQYDEDTTFNENNVVQHLAELEEYISLFITY